MPTHTHRVEIRLSEALRQAIQSHAQAQNETESQFIRRAIEDRIDQLTGESIRTPLSEAVRIGMQDHLKKTEQFVYQTLFEELRFTETYLPWMIELLITAFYKGSPERIHQTLAEYERKSRIAAANATRRKKWVPEHVLQTNDSEALAAGLPQPEDPAN